MSTAKNSHTQESPLDAVRSPDFLAIPKKGKGVRRLNHLPLFVVGGLILLAVAGITYTFFSRQAVANVSIKTFDAPPISSVALPPIRPDGNDYVPADTEITSIENDSVNKDTSSEQNQTPLSEAMQRRLRLIEQVEEKRLAKWEEALNSDGAVQAFSQQRSGPNGTSKSATQQLGNRVNAQDIIEQYIAAVGTPDGRPINAAMSNNSMAAANGQDQKRAFLSGTAEANTYLAQQRKAAIAPSQEVKAGTVIPGVMISGINSDLPGQIIGQVREGVYDSATGSQLLIPSGARLIGIYDSSVTLGQQRVLVAWQRIIYPDSSSISLDNMPGADQGGYAGYHDKVNNHYGRIFGNGLLLSVFSAGIQLSQPQASNGENYNSSQVIAGSLGQQMGQIGMQTAQRNMNIQPTLEISPGYEFNVMVTKDMILPTWEGHPMARGQ